MPTKLYNIPKKKPAIVAEPAVAYQRRESSYPVSTEISTSNRWDPNVPFHGTQEEWWNHFHRIEEGKFMTIEEADREFELWKKKFLLSRM